MSVVGGVVDVAAREVAIDDVDGGVPVLREVGDDQPAPLGGNRAQLIELEAGVLAVARGRDPGVESSPQWPAGSPRPAIVR
jgi:hypothetical protein